MIRLELNQKEKNKSNMITYDLENQINEIDREEMRIKMNNINNILMKYISGVLLIITFGSTNNMEIMNYCQRLVLYGYYVYNMTTIRDVMNKFSRHDIVNRINLFGVMVIGMYITIMLVSTMIDNYVVYRLYQIYDNTITIERHDKWLWMILIMREIWKLLRDTISMIYKIDMIIRLKSINDLYNHYNNDQDRKVNLMIRRSSINDNYNDNDNYKENKINIEITGSHNMIYMYWRNYDVRYIINMKRMVVIYNMIKVYLEISNEMNDDIMNNMLTIMIIDKIIDMAMDITLMVINMVMGMIDKYQNILERYFDSTMENLKKMMILEMIYQVINEREVYMWIVMNMMIRMICEMKNEWLRTEYIKYNKTE